MSARRPDEAAPTPEFAARLLAWFETARRDLPWRRERTPYRVVVSELMLQQTTVTAAIPHFERFVRRFPSWSALAGAEEGDVVAAWAGLGYYRRARNLHALARAVMEAGGEFRGTCRPRCRCRASDRTRRAPCCPWRMDCPFRQWTATWRACSRAIAASRGE